MKKTLFLLALLPAFAYAQNNLVPNPGFEEYKMLPCSYMQEDMDQYIVGWDAANAGTSDYIHDLSGQDCYANPTTDNGQGKQAPHGGHAMVFFTTIILLLIIVSM